MEQLRNAVFRKAERFYGLNRLPWVHCRPLLCMRGTMSSLMRHDFDQLGRPPDTGRMKTRTPREVLEWLCESHAEFWKPSGELNRYALAQALRKATKRRISQSTIERLYKGKTSVMSAETITALEQYFQVPRALIRGDVEWNPLETWGMDITLAELRLIGMVRTLTPTQRQRLYELIGSMLPDAAKLTVPQTQNVIPLLTRKNQK